MPGLPLQDIYWHARSLEFLGQQHVVNLAWLRLPADTIFIVAGVLPLLLATVLTYFNMQKSGNPTVGNPEVQKPN